MKIKNVMQLLLIALSFAFLGCENVLNSDLSEMENGTSRGIVDEATAVKYNLGVGYSVTDKSFKSDPLNRSKLVTRDTNYDNSNILYHDIIEDNFTSLSSNITGIDLGLGVNIGSFSADASFKADMFNELTTAKNSVSMVVSYQHISRKLDVINAELGEEAQDYLLEIGKEAFVKKYGDRYLDTVSLGGSLDFVYTLTTSSSSNISKDKIAAALDVKFRRVFEGNFDYSNEDVSETEMSQMRETVKVFYHSQEPKVVTVKDYQDFLDLSEIFIDDLNDNDLYAVKQTFVKYTELDFDESTFYTALNAWYSTRSTVQMCYNLATAKYWEGDSEAAIAANAASEALIGIGTSIKAFNLSENIYSFPDLTLYDEFRDYLIENDAPISNDIDIPAVPNDFNGDGISDRYVFNSSNGNHYVYINNGSSTVTWRISSPSGYEGFIPHIGDFNGDKKTDILVFCVNRTDKSSQIMISNGSENGLEQFKSKLFYPAVSYHRDSAKYYSGDFNGDGKT
ncbi:MAG: VCBS repeat-containing protein, partial [bacterium]|nr:VCBS repeat-containing protein [bacterium]